MLTTLIQKELRAILLSPKFPAYFAICSALIIISVFIGIREYQASVRQFETGRQLTDQLMHEQSNWSSVANKAFRQPDPMQIFVSGVTFDLGRWSLISENSAARLRSSVYSEDPIFAIFRFMDFSLIVLIVLSLLAIVFTYDAVCGERESGTLRLVFSNAVPRAQYLIAKCAGAWLGLVIPILIPILISCLMLQLFQIPFGASDWIRLGTLIGMAILFMTFFVVCGVFVSTLTKRSSTAFLICLMTWVMFIFIIPRIGVLTAGQLVHVPSVAEIEGKRESFSKDSWQKYYDSMEERWVERREGQHGQPDSVSEEAMWTNLKREDSARKVVDVSIRDYETKLFDDQRRAQLTQQRLAFALCRFSPASAFQLAGMTLSNTDIELKQRFEEAMTRYAADFSAYIEKKETMAPGGMQIAITMDTEGGFNLSMPRGKEELDLSDMPSFQAPAWSAGEAISQVAVDAGLLLCLILAAFTGGWIAFMRYDLR